MLNCVELMGRMTKDPELKMTTTNVPLCTFTIAVQRSKPGRDGKRETDFVNCVSWRDTAKFISTYFRKGGYIIVTGALRSRKYDSGNGTTYTMEVEAEHCEFAGDYDDTDYYDKVKNRAKSSAEREFAKAHPEPEDPVTDFSALEDESNDDKVPF